MYEIDFNKPLHIHFIGIGGISMSGLAEILLKEDFKISGSDAKPSDLVTHLESLGALPFPLEESYLQSMEISVLANLKPLLQKPVNTQTAF